MNSPLPPAGRRLNWTDRAALALLLPGVLWLVWRPAWVRPAAGGLLVLLSLLSLGYLLLFHTAHWVRERFLWSLRDRLIVAYLLIAVVPLLLLTAMAVLSLYLFWHFGAYLLYADIQKRVDQVAATTNTLAAAYALEMASTGEPAGDLTELPPHTAVFLAAARVNLPGLEIAVGEGQELLQRATGRRQPQFAGLVQDQDGLALRAVTERRVSGKPLIVSASVPMDPELVLGMEPELGAIQIDIMRRARETNPQDFVYRTNARTFARLREVQSPDRAVPPPAHWFDYTVSGFTRLDAVDAAAIADPRADVPVIARFTTRASQLNGQLLSLVGEWSGIAVTAWMVVGSFFLVIEIAALGVGVVLTRTITHAVDDLYQATRYVQSGDLTHRIQIQKRDQLGALAESFNSMTASVASLIDEQRRRMRLESELTIAREVQTHLFPKEKPALPGVELEAVCRPARVVSGDYYDFLPLGPARLGIALADVSGKGISAALIMASLQSALRSQTLLDGRAPGGAAEIVARLNRHLYQSTPEERYATFFYGIYDAETHLLEYTNAGHSPPLYLAGREVRRLTTGGTVLGLFPDSRYEAETIEMAPGGLFVAYSDGLTEAENAGGQEFGYQRVLDVVLAHRESPAGALVQALADAAQQWTGHVEHTDDMTVIVARFS